MWMNILKDDYYEKRVAETIESALKRILGARVFTTLKPDPKNKGEYLLDIVSVGKDIETQINENVILKRYVRVEATYYFKETKFENFKFWLFVSRWSKSKIGWSSRYIWRKDYNLTGYNYDLNDLVEMSKGLVDVAEQKIKSDKVEDYGSVELREAITRVFWKGYTDV
jgi:hypothetical protein